MNRTRWYVLVLGLSVSANVFLAIGWGQSQRSARPPTPQHPSRVTTPGDEERRLREHLVSQMCAAPVDRAAIEATFARLDQVRAHERNAALDRWLRGCADITEDDRTALLREVKQCLCPWSEEDASRCAPAFTPGPPQHQPAQPNL
jgi:hypothetical protein